MEEKATERRNFNEEGWLPTKNKTVAIVASLVFFWWVLKKHNLGYFLGPIDADQKRSAEMGLGQ